VNSANPNGANPAVGTIGAGAGAVTLARHRRGGVVS
jgi:hypothetical protein